MEPIRGGSLKRSFTGGVVRGGLRLLSALAAICVVSATAAVAQDATYSDTWSADAPNDGENVVFMEEVQGYVAGCGVTEDDYGYYSYKVQTVLRSPYGRTTSGVGYDQGRVGTDFWYVKACESTVCSLPTSKYVPTSRWSYPRTYLNCSGFRMSVNLGLFRVVGCVGGCVGTEIYSGCR